MEGGRGRGDGGKGRGRGRKGRVGERGRGRAGDRRKGRVNDAADNDISRESLTGNPEEKQNAPQSLPEKESSGSAATRRRVGGAVILRGDSAASLHRINYNFNFGLNASSYRKDKSRDSVRSK